MQLRATTNTYGCDPSWSESFAQVAERVSMRLAVGLVVIASIVLLPVMLVLAVVLPDRESY